MSARKAIVIIGPTAVGKTRLALDLAEKLGRAEIVSADSRQVYRYMTIGTAKPTPSERQRVKHHFIDVRDPDQEYSAGEYGRESRAVIRTLFDNDIVPVITGGSGFYIQALIDGLYAPQISDSVIKEKWRQRILEQGQVAVFEHLRRVDPLSAARLHPNDLQRIVRALEVYDLTGTPVSEYQQGREKACDFTPLLIGLTMDRPKLYQRVNERVLLMMEQGLVNEVEWLKKKGWGPELNALRTVGYQEIFSHLAGELTLQKATELVQRNTRRYAKRQLTWFRKDERIIWLDLDEIKYKDLVEHIVEKFGELEEE